MPTHTLHTNFAIIEVKGDTAADLLAELHHERYEGPTTRAVTDQLWLYGWVNLHARLSDGRIAHLGAAPGAREITERDLDRFTIQTTRDDLVCSTLEGAVPKFVSDVLSTGRYDPHRDTTIATYFTNYTFRRFRSQIHPKWADETKRHEYELGAVQTTDEWYSAAGTTPDHADDVLHALSAHQTAVYVIKHFANLTERPVALGVLRGQTHNEIAADLGITPKAVERRLASFRNKAWRHRPHTPTPDNDTPNPPDTKHDTEHNFRTLDDAWWDWAIA